MNRTDQLKVYLRIKQRDGFALALNRGVILPTTTSSPICRSRFPLLGSGGVERAPPATRMMMKRKKKEKR